MKKVIFFVLVLLLNKGEIYSQWNIINVGTTQDLYSADYYSVNDIWIGSFNQIVKSSTGGTSWNSGSLVDNSSNIIQPVGIYDLALVSSTNAIGTGLFSLGNVEQIINTSNSGTSWSYVSTNTTVGLPRYLNSLDVSSTRAIAVGNNGRIARSTNGGNSWSIVSSGISTYINEVKFATYDTVFAVGDYRILKSVNGGATWTYTTVNGGLFRSVGCDHSTVYIGDAANNSVLKSINYGTSYSTINLPFSYQGVLYVVDKDTLVAAGDDGLYVSRSGGQYWEKYILPSYIPIRMFDFYDQNTGIGVGNTGFVIKTDNLSLAPKIPISTFSISGASTYCVGDSVFFANSTIPGCNYQWKINGINYSSTYNIGIILNAAGSQNFTLISTNGYGADTMNITINVVGHNQINAFTFSASTDTICNGSSVVFSLPASQSGVSYQLRKNLSNVGVAKPGTGSTLTFNSGVTSGTNSFNIRAIRSNTCFTDSVVNFKTIYSANALASTVFYISRDTVCFNDTASLIIPNSLVGYKYTWYNSTINTSGTAYVNGNGSTISIPLSARTATESFAPKAVHISKGCSSTFNPTKVVKVDRTTSYFTLNNYNPEVGEIIYSINNSVNPNGYYQWDFGVGANNQYSNANSPMGIIYISPGQRSIKLVNTTSFGCKDSLIKQINILVPFADDSCSFTQIASQYNGGRGIAMQYDYQDNLIHLYNGGSANRHLVYSNHNDSIVTNLIPIQNYYEQSCFLTKINSKGVPKWTTKLWYYSSWGRPGDIETDTSGNIYFTFYDGTTTSDSVRIYSSDNSYKTIKIHWTSNFLILKYDKDGIFQWYNNFGGYGNESLVMKADKFGNLYVCTGSNLTKFNSIGQLVWSKTGSFSDVDIDNQGFIWINNNSSNNRDIMVQKYDTTGNLVFTSSPLIKIGSAPIESQYLKLDDQNNIYMAGIFHGKFIYNNDTIGDPYIGGAPHEDVFLCKMKPNGQQEWFKHFKSNTNSYIKGLDIKNNHIVLSITNYGDTVSLENLAPVIFTSEGHFLYHTDSLGNSESINKLYETTQAYISGNVKGLCFKKNSEDLSLGLEFNTNFLYSGTTVIPYSTNITVHNFFIGNGGISCFLPDIPLPNSPHSYFITPTLNTCSGQNVTFSDHSFLNPTVWNWSFPGGIPSSSSLQNPIITYNTPGIYYATLITSNSFGIGTTYTDAIQINPLLPTITITGDTSVCEGAVASYNINATGTGLSYQWQDSSSTQTWTNINSATNSYFNSAPILFSQNGNKYRCIVSNNCDYYQSSTITLTVTPNVSLSLNTDTLCVNSGLYTLSGGIPSGGVYSGSGISNGVFDPFAAGNGSGGSHLITYTYPFGNNCNNDDTDILYLKVCTGIQSISNYNQIIVSPNPSSGKFKIELGDKQLIGNVNLEIYNIMGEKIYFSHVDKLNNTMLDISEKPSGIYFLIIISEKENKMIKIFKM